VGARLLAIRFEIIVAGSHEGSETGQTEKGR